jgi:hypothetical protein
MKQTARSIETELRRLIKESPLKASVYFADALPELSKTDRYITVQHTAGIEGDVQEGIATVNYFIPALSGGVANVQMIELVERKAAEWAYNLKPYNGWYWQLADTISTHYDHNATIYFVSIRLKYKHYTEEY